MHVLVTCKYKKDRIKNNREKVATSFPHYKSMGAFCCHGNQSFNPICPKTLCSLCPTPEMLLIKFDYNWPTGLGGIIVWKCGQRTTTTDDRALLNYKLTLWAFGSGEAPALPPRHWMLPSTIARLNHPLGKECVTTWNNCIDADA